jgi:hypothetical protein
MCCCQFQRVLGLEPSSSSALILPRCGPVTVLNPRKLPLCTVGCEVLTAVVINAAVFWFIAPCIP